MTFSGGLKRGCRAVIYTNKLEILFVIESAEISFLKAAISIKIAENRNEGHGVYSIEVPPRPC
jgi:hypothetical protein